MARARGTLLLCLAGSAAFAWSAVAECSKSVLLDGRPRFEVGSDEVRDRSTGLLWKRCSLARGGNSDCGAERTLASYAEAKSAAEKAGRGWRLPTFEELVGLLDQDCGQPAIDLRVFPDVTAAGSEGTEEYWTTTPGGIRDMMSTVEFSYGYREIRSPGFRRRARLVRSGG